MSAYEIVVIGLFIPINFYLVTRLFNHVFIRRQEARGMRVKRWLLCLGVLAVLILLGFRPLPYITVLVSMILLSGYEKDRQRMALVGLVMFSISVYWMLLFDLITRVLPQPVFEGPILSFLYVGFLWLIYYIGLAVLYELLRYTTSRQTQQLPKNMWFMLLLIPTICLVSYVCCYYAVILQSQKIWSAMVIPLSFAMLFINSILLMLYDSLATMVKATREKALLDQQLQMQNEYYTRLHTAQKRIAALNHDMKNHLRTASQLASTTADSGELVAYLDSVAQRLGKINTVISTGNPGLDSILNIKIAELASEKIPTDIQTHIPPSLQLNFEQAVVIFGNLLDNAKEACLALEFEQRFVNIRLSYANEMLFIQLENSSLPIEKWQDGLPCSTKEDSLVHGLGLKNVQKIVEENGSMLVKAEGGKFVITITLYLQLPKNDNYSTQK